jgi:menaquinone-dependent protoporphyrinogen IX oxidase
MYSVICGTLLTGTGKLLVWKYEGSLDAQSIYRGLLEHYTKSTKASIDKSNLLRYITAARIGDGTYKETTHSFILHWQKWLQKYESQVDTTDHFSDPSKMAMLQNAVYLLEELRTVKLTADHNTVITGKKTLTYEEYPKLLCSAAIGYDVQFKHQGA